jgi:hypothetical protein
VLTFQKISSFKNPLNSIKENIKLPSLSSKFLSMIVHQVKHGLVRRSEFKKDNKHRTANYYVTTINGEQCYGTKTQALKAYNIEKQNGTIIPTTTSTTQSILETSFNLSHPSSPLQNRNDLLAPKNKLSNNILSPPLSPLEAASVLTTLSTPKKQNEPKGSVTCLSKRKRKSKSEKDASTKMEKHNEEKLKDSIAFKFTLDYIKKNGLVRKFFSGPHNISFQRITAKTASTFLQSKGEFNIAKMSMKSTHAFGLFVSGGLNGQTRTAAASSNNSSNSINTTANKNNNTNTNKFGNDTCNVVQQNFVGCQFYDSDDETTLNTVVEQVKNVLQTTGGKHSEWSYEYVARKLGTIQEHERCVGVLTLTMNNGKYRYGNRINDINFQRLVMIDSLCIDSQYRKCGLGSLLLHSTLLYCNKRFGLNASITCAPFDCFVSSTFAVTNSSQEFLVSNFSDINNENSLENMRKKDILRKTIQYQESLASADLNDEDEEGVNQQNEFPIYFNEQLLKSKSLLIKSNVQQIKSCEVKIIPNAEHANCPNCLQKFGNVPDLSWHIFSKVCLDPQKFEPLNSSLLANHLIVQSKKRRRKKIRGRNNKKKTSTTKELLTSAGQIYRPNFLLPIDARSGQPLNINRDHRIRSASLNKITSKDYDINKVNEQDEDQVEENYSHLQLGQRVKVLRYDTLENRILFVVGTLVQNFGLMSTISYDVGNEKCMESNSKILPFATEGTRVQAYLNVDTGGHGVVTGWNGGVSYDVFYDTENKVISTHGSELILSKAGVEHIAKPWLRDMVEKKKKEEIKMELKSKSTSSTGIPFSFSDVVPMFQKNKYYFSKEIKAKLMEANRSRIRSAVDKDMQAFKEFQCPQLNDVITVLFDDGKLYSGTVVSFKKRDPFIQWDGTKIKDKELFHMKKTFSQLEHGEAWAFGRVKDIETALAPRQVQTLSYCSLGNLDERDLQASTFRSFPETNKVGMKRERGVHIVEPSSSQSSGRSFSISSKSSSSGGSNSKTSSSGSTRKIAKIKGCLIHPHLLLNAVNQHGGIQQVRKHRRWVEVMKNLNVTFTTSIGTRLNTIFKYYFENGESHY